MIIYEDNLEQYLYQSLLKSAMKQFIVTFFCLISQAFAINLGCQFINASLRIEKTTILTAYSCRAITMDFSDNFTHVTKITGNHIKEHSNEDVKIVWFYHDFCPSFMLKNIPKGLSNFFQNMQVLFFGSCPIDNLNGDELEEYSNLETFINIYSKIKKVPGSFFKNNQKLKHIQFNNNQIEKIGTKLFDGVENLESIWFEENICVNNSAQSKVEVLRLIQDLKEKCPDETDEIGRTEQNEELETTTGLEGTIYDYIK